MGCDPGGGLAPHPGNARVKGFASRGLVPVKCFTTRSHQFILTGCSTCTCCRVKGFASRGSRIKHGAENVLRLRAHSLADNGFYIGFSTDLKRRLSEHTRGASFATKSRGPWKLIYYEAYTERKDALGRERYLKSGSGRRFLRAQLRHYLLQVPLARPRRAPAA